MNEDHDDEKHLLSHQDDLCSDSSDEILPSHRSSRWTTSRPGAVIITLLNLIILALSLGFFLAATVHKVSDQDHYRATSAYSPILERFTIPKVTKTVNGSLYEDPPSILRDTSRAGDHEWFQIGTGVFPVVLSSKDVIRLGKDPALGVKIPEEHGYGEDAYIAQTDVFHHLHCVDMLRKEIYHPWSGLDEAKKLKMGGERQHWAHVGHCIDILAQAIKCSGSVDMIMFNWVEGWDQPFPDFATQKVCRDFDALLEYVNSVSIPHEVFQAMKQPPKGYQRLPEPGGAGSHLTAVTARSSL